jgi:hypothetical protein
VPTPTQSAAPFARVGVRGLRRELGGHLFHAPNQALLIHACAHIGFDIEIGEDKADDDLAESGHAGDLDAARAITARN